MLEIQNENLQSQVIENQATHRNDLIKVIALVTMLIDHIGMLYFPEYMQFRTIGRIAFPIFAYQIAVGFQKTSSRLRYGKRLFLFACLSQIPYLWFNTELVFYFGSLNIMFTFFIALCALQCFEMGKNKLGQFKDSKSYLSILKALGFYALCVVIIIAPEITRFKYGIGTEYGMNGILFVFLFYFLGKKKLPLLVGYIALSAFSSYYSLARYYYSSASNLVSFFEAFTSFNVVIKTNWAQNSSPIWLTGAFFQSRSIMAVPIIWLGNYVDRVQMTKIHLNKYVGYFFYPVHIAILLLIKYFLMKM
jgi:hypothetical protein